MMSTTTRCTRAAAALLGAAMAACSAASPDPAAIAAAELPALQLDEASAQRAADAAARAVAAVDSGRFSLAEDIATDVLDTAPRQPRARAVLGLCLQHRASAVSPPDLRLLNTGEGETLRACRLAPTDLVVGRLRARFLAATGHLSAAAAAGESVLAQNPRGETPDYVALLACCAEWRYELGEEHLALPHLQALGELRPADAVAQYRLGICLLRTARTAAEALAAAAAFAHSAQLQPADEQAQLSVGKAHVRAAELGSAADRDRELDAALAAFRAAAAGFATSAEPPFCAGIVLEQRQRDTEAATAYEAALQRDPNHVGALLDLARLRLRDPATAAAGRELLKRALAATPGDRGALTPRERAGIEKYLLNTGG